MASSRKDNKGRKLKDGESQRKDGRYQFRYSIGKGKRHVIYAATLNELREKEKEIQRDIMNDVITFSPNTTLNDIFKLYINGKSELKQSTKTNYKYMYKTFIKEEIGFRKIKSLKYSDIKSFYNYLINERGLQPNTMEIIHSILHPTFTLAVRDGYISANPTDGVMTEIKKSHSWEKPKRFALTIQEQETFINYVTNSTKYKHWLPLFTFFLGTGCRIGEVIGLRWEDCNFKENTISINHNLIYRVQDSGKCELHITTPKTSAGTRIIPMLIQVKNALLQERRKQMTEGFNQSEIDGYKGFIFKNRYNKVCRPHSINRAIKRIVRDINAEEKAKAEQLHREPFIIRDFSAHNLRHTFCTRFCENETNLKVIQEIMGHSDISVTMNIYAEATMDKKAESFLNLEGKIKIN